MSTEFSFISAAHATAFLFPGQGSQQVGMAQAICAAYPVARQTFAEADDLLGFALSRLCAEGPEEALTETYNAQPAILTASIAILRVIQQELSQVDLPATPIQGEQVYVAGHSLGEYTALVAAGSLSFADGLRLVRERGRLMKAAGDEQPGMMAAVLGLEEAQIAAICAAATANGGIAQVANDNCPGQLVISGDRPGMEAAMAALTAAGARKIVPLAVSIASHSPLMQPAAVELRKAIEATPIQPPLVPLIANTSAQPLTNVDALRNELVSQLTGSVRWTASMQHALRAGVTQFVEIGAGDVLTGLMKRIERTAGRQAISTPESVLAFVQTLRAG